MAISYRQFDFQKDDINRLFELFMKTYGDASVYKERWKWEYAQNPQKDDLKIFIAEGNETLAGATTRFPLKIKCQGEIVKAAFNVNSMVHPDFRRRGIMEKLYEMSAEMYPVLFSKGTKPGMYKLLMKMGYKQVLPDTFLTTVLAPLRWSLWRMGVYKPEVKLEEKEARVDNEFEPIHLFSSEFDDFYNRVSRQYICNVVKDSAYMNWRYIHIPHKTYKAFFRRKNEEIISAVVIGQYGTTAKIVDLLWDLENSDEPFCTIKFARKFCRENGFLKMLCWGPFENLRRGLKKNFFTDRGEALPFSVYAKHDDIDKFTVGRNFHFVEGDGDSEYL